MIDGGASRVSRLGAHRCATLAGVLLTLLAAPSTVLAANTTGPLSTTTSPLSGFPNPPVSTPSSQTQPIVTNASTSPAGSSSLSSGSAIAIAIGAVLLLGGISFFIWHDARRRAPVKPAGGGRADSRGRVGSKPPPKPRKPSPAERRRRKRGRARR